MRWHTRAALGTLAGMFAGYGTLALLPAESEGRAALVLVATALAAFAVVCLTGPR